MRPGQPAKISATLRAGLLAAIAGAGCGRVTPNGSADGGLTASQACTALAQAECDKRDSCSRGSNIVHLFGEKGVCLARLTLGCADAMAAPGAGNGPATAMACSAAYATLSCNDFFDGKLPPPCMPVGSVPDGQPCAFNGQCASSFCKGTRNRLCGSCAPEPQPGDSCADSACGHGQTCVSSTMTCQNLGLLNAACGPTAPCGNGLACLDSGAGMGPTCALAVGQIGVACGGASMPTCDNTLGLYCGGKAGAKTCMATTYVGERAPCGSLGGGAAAQCQAGGCYTATGAAGQGEMGACRLDAPEGAQCDAVLGPDCVRPARCVTSGGSSSGTCVLPTGAGCG